MTNAKQDADRERAAEACRRVAVPMLLMVRMIVALMILVVCAHDS